MKAGRMAMVSLAFVLVWNLGASTALAGSLTPGLEDAGDLDDWPSDDDDVPDEENDYESDLEREDADYIPDDIEVGIDDDDEFSGGEGTYTLSGSAWAKTTTSAGGVASASKGAMVAQADGNRLAYPKGTAYGTRVVKNVKVRSKVENGRSVFALHQNDRVMRVGGLQKDSQGKIWARVTLLGGRMGYVPYSALAKGGATVQSSGKIYAATMAKSVYICDENGAVYKTAVLRKGVDIAVQAKISANDMEWYTLVGVYGLEKNEDATAFLVPAEAVTWSKGEPEDIAQ